MNGSGERPQDNVRLEPGLPLNKLKHCKIGAICWFTRFDGSNYFRDLGVILDIDRNAGLIIVGSLTTFAGLPQHYKNGNYEPSPKQPFGCPVKTDLNAVKEHLKKIEGDGVKIDMRDLAPEARRVVMRARKI